MELSLSIYAHCKGEMLPEEAVYVLHVFQKKTQKTSRSDIELGQQRYKQLLQQREDDAE
jgi:phage-related protein